MTTPPIKIITLTPDELEALFQRLTRQAVQIIREADRADTDLLTIRSAAEALHKRRETIQHAVEVGALPAKRQGKNWAIVRRDLMAWAKRSGFIA